MKQQTQYDRVRGVRMPDRLWQSVKRLSKKSHQTPSDFIRHAIKQRAAAIAAQEKDAA